MHYPEVDARSWPLLFYPFTPFLSCFYLKRPIIKSFNKTLRCTAEDSERLELKTTNTLVPSFQKGGFDSRMSDYSSDSRRLQALESNVTEIQGQMSELMGMMRQLTQTRTAGAGQHEEESGGTGRGAAHNPNIGAGRVPPTAVTGYGVTAVGVGRTRDAAAVEATAAREFTVHDRATSEPADTRPVLPTGVGPMIDVQRGEARDPYLAGITAYDEGRDVLRTDFKSLPARVVPPVLKAEKGGFQKFKREFFLKANMLDITAHSVDQGMRAVPVGDPLKQKAVLLQEGFSNEEIRSAYQAWNFIDAALQSELDRSILKRCKSPREVFERLEKWHDPDSEVATQ